MTIWKTFEIKVLEKRKDGGRIAINTGSVDRDRDRVFPSGARVDNYQRNPVVQWGHNYRDPWATVGKTNTLEISPEAVIADFVLRPAANEQDPQNIVLLLWEGGWVRTASIGFVPIAGKPNDVGGTDYGEWELLEWSLVPIPSNQDALRLAVKGMDCPEGISVIKAACRSCGKEVEFSATLFSFIATGLAPQLCQDCVRTVEKSEAPSRAWIRQLTIESNMGEQTLFACFRSWEITVPDGAEKLMSDEENGFYLAPHPLAGQTIQQKEVTFIPPIEFEDEWGKDAMFSITVSGKDDAEMVKQDSLWSVKALSDVLLSIPVTKSAKTRAAFSMGVCSLKHRDVERVKAIISRRAATKRGRVLSAKNEEKIVSARDNLNEVLAQLDEQQPEGDDEKGTPIPNPSPVNTQGKGAIPPHETLMAPPDTEWDGPGVMADCPNERAKLRLICAWVDDKGDPDAKQSYKFPHHLLDGKVVLRGVNNARARLPQAEIPEGDRPGVDKHLTTHQAQFEKAVMLRDFARALNEVADEVERGHGPRVDADGERDLAETLRMLLNTLKEVV